MNLRPLPPEKIGYSGTEIRIGYEYLLKTDIYDVFIANLIEEEVLHKSLNRYSKGTVRSQFGHRKIDLKS